VVFATNAPVERQDARGAFLERLDMNQDWTGFVGAPVLDSHKRGALGDVLGSVVSATTVGGEGRATIRISKRRKAESIVDDIRAGHVRGVSVGYRVAEWKDSAEGGKRVRTATKWAPAELSIVAVPADPGATIRSQTLDTTLQTDRAATNIQIRAIASVSGLPQTWTDEQIDQGATLDQAREAAFAALQARSDATAGIRVATAFVTGHDATDPAWRIRTIGEALHCRMTGTAPSEAARPFATVRCLTVANTLSIGFVVRRWSQ
jgi:HK97 family phage prohead protease